MTSEPTVPRRTALHAGGVPPASVVGPNLRTLVEGLNHPEGVCWSPAQQRVYAGGDAGEIYRFGLDDDAAEMLCTIPGGSIRGIAVDGDGAIYACDVGNGCIQRITPDGTIRRYGSDIGYPNYPVFDEAGRLWVSDSGTWGTDTGGIVRIDPAGSVRRVVDGLHFANGLAIRGDWLYIVESTWPRVVRVPLSGGEPRTVIELDQVVPDGLAFDVDGGLWISCWQPNRVYRLATDGDLAIIVDDWSGVYAATPTNVAFAGPTRETLVLASLGSDVVSACDPGYQGAPLHYPHPTTQEEQNERRSP